MVEIVDFNPSFKEAFKQLNYEWISKYFEVEETDREMLEDPEGHIIDKGGAILIALMEEEPIGTCALIKMEGSKYELAKMAVSPKAQRQKIGLRLGEATIKKARELKADALFLETNSVLKPAINLYKKLGFAEITGTESPYNRCNVQMELKL
ncbi:MAG: hypothetical protein Tsb0034_07280 [Ekhidna sp.]